MTDVNADSNAVSLVSSFISKYISWILMRLHDPSPKRRERVIAREQSQAIDRMLKEDAKARSRVWRVLPMGAYRMREIAALLKAQNDDRIGLTQDELISYRINIYQRIITCAKAFVNAIELSNSSLKMGGNSDHYSYLRGYTAHPYFDSPLDDKIINAIRTLWKELPIAEVFTSKDDVHGIQEAARYFFDDLDRVTAPNYTPTETDIFHSRLGYVGAREHRFFHNDMSLVVIDTGPERASRRKWINQFQYVTATLFVVDLLCYDEVLDTSNTMESMVGVFESVVNSRWFTTSTMILLLNNVSAFREKLFASPFGAYFMDYTGKNDFREVMGYLVEKFSKVNETSKEIYVHLMDPHDPTTIETIFAAINDSLAGKPDPRQPGS